MIRFTDQLPKNIESAGNAWNQALEELGETRYPDLRALWDWLDQDRNAVSRYLVGGKNIPSSSMEGYVRELVALWRDMPDRIQAWIPLIRRVVRCGNDARSWNLQLPSIPIQAKREKGRFTPERFALRGYFDDWKVIFHQSLISIDDLSTDARVGQLLTSAVLYGGLHRSHLLIELARQLEADVHLTNGVAHIDLVPGWQGHEDVEYRRWFPDPMTETLIWRLPRDEYRVPSQNHKKASEELFARIKRFFIESKSPKAKRPRNLTQLIDIASMMFEIRMPPFVFHYQLRSYRGHSLKASAWNRLLTPQNKELNEVIGSLDLGQWSARPVISSEEQGSEPEDDSETQWINELRSALNVDRQEDMIEGLARLKTEVASGLLSEALLLWGLHLLQSGTRAQRTPKPSTVKTYINLIAARLDEYLGTEPLMHLGSAEFEEAYILVLDDLQSKSARRKVARVLYEFHHFLVKHQQAADIDFHGVLGAHSAPVPVDANLVWLDEYHLMQQALLNSDLIQLHPELVDVTQLILMLGYRCGLRRNEVLKLRLVDVQGWVDPMLLVRPHAERKLKTSSSKRQLPLKALLTKDEITQLRNWFGKRQAYEVKADFSPYLFAIPEKDYYFVPEDLVFPAIHQVMRTVTGDESLRFHHLRHSFASLTLLKLMASDHGIPEKVFDEMPMTLAWLSDAQTFRDELHRVTGPTRKHLYYVSAMLGHSLPDVTQEHYLHLTDMMAAHIRDQRMAPDNKALVIASGQPEASAYRQLALGRQAYIAWIRKRYGPKPKRRRSSRIKAINSQVFEGISVQENHWKNQQQIWQLLYLHSAHGVDLEVLEARFTLPRSRIEQLIDTAKQFREETANNRLGRSRFKMMLQDKSGESLLCPRPPMRESDLIIARHLTQKLGQMKESNPALFRNGMTLFKKHAWRTKQLVVFRNPEQAEVFLVFLKATGTQYKQIAVSVLHGQEADKRWIRAAKRYWKTALEDTPGIQSMAWESKPATDGETMGKHGWLGINLLNPEYQQASPAARYVLLMQLIMIGRLH